MILEREYLRMNEIINIMDLEKKWCEHGPITEELIACVENGYDKSIYISTDFITKNSTYVVYNRWRTDFLEFNDLQKAIDYYNNIGKCYEI